MSKIGKTKSAARRDFLRTAGLGAIVGVTAASVESRKADAAVAENTGDSGYRETGHVKKAYELSRF